MSFSILLSRRKLWYKTILTKSCNHIVWVLPPCFCHGPKTGPPWLTEPIGVLLGFVNSWIWIQYLQLISINQIRCRNLVEFIYKWVYFSYVLFITYHRLTQTCWMMSKIYFNTCNFLIIKKFILLFSYSHNIFYKIISNTVTFIKFKRSFTKHVCQNKSVTEICKL